MNTLTLTKRYKLRIDLADFNGTTAYAEYDNFVVISAADKYKLSSLGNYTGTAGKISSMLGLSACVRVCYYSTVGETSSIPGLSAFVEMLLFEFFSDKFRSFLFISHCINLL